MRIVLLLFCLVFLNNMYAQVLDTSARWTWMAGEKTLGAGQAGAFRTAAAANAPSARMQTTTIWCDQTGKVWLFGGTPAGSGINSTGRNDMWVFDQTVGTNGEWYWQGGPDPQHGHAVGIKGGAAHEDNIPKARSQAGKWTDKDGNLWVFGGFQHNGIYTNNAAGANDLWMFNPTTKEWRWVAGDTVTTAPATYKTGVYPANKGDEGMPGGRGAMITWTDTAGHLWLYGGVGVTTTTSAGQLGDIWKFDIKLEKWFWMGGSKTTNAAVNYNGATTPGTPGGFPGGRQSLAGWRDLNDNLYIFSGVGAAGSGSLLSDMWRYNPRLDEWTWVRAAAPNASYGTPGIPDPANEPGKLYVIATATDKYGKFWMLGGRWTPGNDNMQNALWMYDPVSNMWTRVNGDAGNDRRGRYGTKHVPDKDNQPGSRQGFMCYCDNENELWLFGGNGWPETGSSRGSLNDLWRFAHVAPPSCTLAATITPAGSAAFCPGDSVVLRANKVTGAAYEWRNGATVLPQASDSIIVKAAGSYTVKITDATCNATSAPVTVTVYPLPVANPAPSGVHTICPGDTLTLNAAATGMNYQWCRNGSPVGTNAAAYDATQAGIYTLVVTNPSTGCRDSSSVATDLRLHTLPDAAVTPSGAQSLCAGDTVSLSAANTSAGHTYQWFRDGNNIAGAVASGYRAGQAGSYWVRVTDQSTGCADTSAVAAVITVHPLPVVSVTPAGVIELCQGDQEQLTATPGTGYYYEWVRANAIVATGAAYTVNTAGDYYVRVTDNNNCKDSSAVTAVIVRDRPQFTVLPGDTAFCEGGMVLYEVHTQDTGLSYQWQKDNADIPGATLPYYEVRYSGSYTVVANWNTLTGCGDSVADLQVTVHVLPVPSIEWDGVELSTDGGYTDYQWYIGGQPVPGAKDSLFVPEETGAYTVSVTDTNGCSNTSVVYNVTALRTGMGHLSGGQDYTIYPNPVAGGIVYIAGPEPVSLVISGMDGRIILQQADAREADISGLPEGVYLMQIKNKDGYLIGIERLIHTGH